MKPRVYQRCPSCARVTPFDAALTRCPHDGAVMLTQCQGCGWAINSPFATHCERCGAAYRAIQTHASRQVKTPP